MKLKEYSKHITDMAKKYPDLEVISARDEEGNGFFPVYYHPTLGIFENDNFDDDPKDTSKYNAICIN